MKRIFMFFVFALLATLVFNGAIFAEKPSVVPPFTSKGQPMMVSGSGEVPLTFYEHKDGLHIYKATYESSFVGTVGHITLTVRTPVDVFFCDAYIVDENHYAYKEYDQLCNKYMKVKEINDDPYLGENCEKQYIYEFDGPNFMVEMTFRHSANSSDDPTPQTTKLVYYYTYTYSE